eukprot:scaffold7849_cov30-Phaeocystis_antarctica.AAC.1
MVAPRTSLRCARRCCPATTRSAARCRCAAKPSCRFEFGLISRPPRGWGPAPCDSHDRAMRVRGGSWTNGTATCVGLSTIFLDRRSSTGKLPAMSEWRYLSSRE